MRGNILVRRAAVFWLLLALCGAAQQKGAVVSGFVADSLTASPLPGCVVWLTGPDSQPVSASRASSANGLGFFSIANVPNGTYLLNAYCIGYTPVKLPVTVPLTTVRLNIKLRQATLQLEEVTISAGNVAPALTGAVVVPASLLKLLPSLTGTEIIKPLLLLPGITQRSELSAGLYVRGGSPDENLTLIDGIPSYTPAHLGNFSGTFAAGAAQSVKLIKGAFPAEYGGRMGSVLDVTLRSGTRELPKGEVSVGTFSSELLLEGPLNSGITYLLNGKAMYYNWLQEAFSSGGTAPRYGYADASAKFTGTVSASDVVSISGAFTGDRLNSPSGSVNGNYSLAWSGRSGGISWLHINANSLFLTTTLALVDYSSRSAVAAPRAGSSAPSWYSLSGLSDIIIRTSAEAQRDLVTRVKAGSELVLHRYKQEYSSSWNPAQSATAQVQPAVIASEAAAYLQFEQEPIAGLFTNAGIRVYYYRSRNFFRLEPRVSASYNAGGLLFKAAYAEANQFLHLVTPEAIALPVEFWFPSSGAVTPSFSRQYAAGAELAPLPERMVITIDGYYKELQGLYSSRGAPAANGTEAFTETLVRGEGEAYGAEMLLTITGGSFTGWAGYTLAYTQRRFPGISGGKVFPPRYDHRHSISLVLAYSPLPGLSASASFVFATGDAFTMPDGWYSFTGVIPGSTTEQRFSYAQKNAYRLPPYHRLDLNLTWSVSKTYSVALNAYNVYNRANPFAWYPATSSDGLTTVRQLSIFPFIPSVQIKAAW